MGNSRHDHSSPLDYVIIDPAPETHIKIINEKLCNACENKPCTYFCPSRVYSWTERIQADYTRCIECGACPYGCPQQNIAWEYPRQGYGVHYGILTERRLKAESGIEHGSR